LLYRHNKGRKYRLKEYHHCNRTRQNLRLHDVNSNLDEHRLRLSLEQEVLQLKQVLLAAS